MQQNYNFVVLVPSPMGEGKDGGLQKTIGH